MKSRFAAWGSIPPSPVVPRSRPSRGSNATGEVEERRGLRLPQRRAGHWTNAANPTHHRLPADVNYADWDGLAPYRDEIRAAFMVDRDYAIIFLSDGDHLRYDINADKLDHRYPLPIDAGQKALVIVNENWGKLNQGAKEEALLGQIESGHDCGIMVLGDEQCGRLELALVDGRLATLAGSH